jgi:hypothetical protein
MRPICAVVLAALLSLLTASAEAKYVCGVFEGKFSCRYESSGTPKVKGAVPGARQQPARRRTTPAPGKTRLPPPGTWSNETSPGGAPAPSATACQNGMVGTPPNCRCPPNSEMLGGNCVRYTASTCSNGLASDALPQACRGIEEKLSCKMRDDGLKDCCCITYDKF